MIKKSLCDLIPIAGIFNVAIKTGLNTAKTNLDHINKKINRREWFKEAFKDSCYVTLISGYNLALLSIYPIINYINKN